MTLEDKISTVGYGSKKVFRRGLIEPTVHAKKIIKIQM